MALLQSRFGLAYFAVIGGLLIFNVIGQGEFVLAP